MRVSEYYGLNLRQPSLDFVDVDISDDIEIFVDPRALRYLSSEWGSRCSSLVQSFFRSVLAAIREGRDGEAQRLLSCLREPNETHLGYSRGRSQGHALGSTSAQNVWRALRKSEAVRSGLLEDLEDTILMVEGIDADIVSDITTNLIRRPLIEYTQQMCHQYRIPVETEIDSGPLWDVELREWHSCYVSLPVTSEGKLLLVPKVIARRRMDFRQDEYYQHYILEHLAHVEVAANTELVRLIRGEPHVTKKDLKKKYGGGKRLIVEVTQQYPEILDKYRNDKRQRITPPLTHEEIAEAANMDWSYALPDWESLLTAVKSVEPGPAGATQYHAAIEQFLAAIFYPSLTNPLSEVNIHDGRKRIDITYVNEAREGFFGWLSNHYPSSHIMVECKNYSRDLANPELDQLSGRFSPNRGQVGLLVCRHFNDKKLFIQRCKDTASDHRGFIIPLDDCDLISLVEEAKQARGRPGFGLLKQRFDRLIL